MVPNDAWAALLTLVFGGAFVIGLFAMVSDLSGAARDKLRDARSLEMDFHYEDGSGESLIRRLHEVRGRQIAYHLEDSETRTHVYVRYRVPRGFVTEFSEHEWFPPPEFVYTNNGHDYFRSKQTQSDESGDNP